MANEAARQLVWDWPTRIFHWLLVVLIAFAWWTGEEHDLVWHNRAGMALVVLLVFRILWGLFGTSTARFSQFVKGPGSVWSYVRPSSTAPLPIGHNPIGGWSVIVMLLLVLVVVVTGLFANDIDGMDSGPLNYLVSYEQGELATAIHDYSFDLLLVVVAIHILAIIYYLVVRRRNLIGPMVTGFQSSEGGADGSAVLVPRWRVLAALLVAVLLAYGVWNGFRF